MDPNAALENILTGFMIVDHAEALREWLRRGGFSPAVRQLPAQADCAVFVREHVTRHYHSVADYTTIRVRADRNGLWTAPEAGQWISLGVWPELLRMGDE
jgi:hypothetical protein